MNMSAGRALIFCVVVVTILWPCDAMDVDVDADVESPCDQDTVNRIAFTMAEKYLEHRGKSNFDKAVKVVEDNNCDEKAIEEFFVSYSKLKKQTALKIHRLNLETVIDFFGYQNIRASCLENQKDFQISGGFYGTFMGYQRTLRSCRLSPKFIDDVFKRSSLPESYGGLVRELVEGWRFKTKSCNSDTAGQLTAILKAIMEDRTSLMHAPREPLSFLFCLHPEQKNVLVKPPKANVRTEAAYSSDDRSGPRCALRSMGSVSATEALHFYASSVDNDDLYWPEFGLDRIMTEQLKREFETKEIWGTKIVRNIMVVRGSSRTPDDVFRQGFVAHPDAGSPPGVGKAWLITVHQLTLMQLECSNRADDTFKLKNAADAEKAMVYHTGPDNNSCWFVSTTLAPQIGIKFAGKTPMGWVYLAVAREGIELVQHNGEGEVLMPYGCPGVDILAARKVLTAQHGYIGDVVFNRDFAGTLDPDTEAEMLEKFLCWKAPAE